MGRSVAVVASPSSLSLQNSKLKTELQKATEEIRQKSLKKEYREKGVKENEEILDDDLTIVGIGK